ncbi:Alpha/Beta hydrolase protein [Bisporella sp. PMI_857]|nr:Alpha/Beta hydrolase protein [Bisporella sp. PMI_857]
MPTIRTIIYFPFRLIQRFIRPLSSTFNLLLARVIWVLWILRSLQRSKANDSSSTRFSSPNEGRLIQQSSGNTIQYFLHLATPSSSLRTPANILLLTGLGRENTDANLTAWVEYLTTDRVGDCGEQVFNLCMVNYPGYGGTSGRTRRHQTTEEQILANLATVLDIIKWQEEETTIIGISYGSFVAVSALSILSRPPKALILISPGLRIRSVLLTSEVPLGLDRLRRAFLALCACLGASEALAFNTRAALSALNARSGKPPIYALHGTEDENIPVECSRELKRIYRPFHLTEVLGAGHANTRFGEAQKVIWRILGSLAGGDGYVPPERVVCAPRKRGHAAD